MAVSAIRTTGAFPYELSILEAGSGKQVSHLKAAPSSSQLLGFLADDKTVILPGPKGTILFWDLAKASQRTQSLATDAVPTHVALGGKVVLARAERAILVFRLDTGERQASFSLGNNIEMRVAFVALSGNGEILLAAGYDDPNGRAILTMRWWDLSTAKELGHIQGKLTGETINALSLSHDGQRLAIGSGTNISIWRRE